MSRFVRDHGEAGASQTRARISQGDLIQTTKERMGEPTPFTLLLMSTLEDCGR